MHAMPNFNIDNIPEEVQRHMIFDSLSGRGQLYVVTGFTEDEINWLYQMTWPFCVNVHQLGPRPCSTNRRSHFERSTKPFHEKWIPGIFRSCQEYSGEAWEKSTYFSKRVLIFSICQELSGIFRGWQLPVFCSSLPWEERKKETKKVSRGVQGNGVTAGRPLILANYDSQFLSLAGMRITPEKIAQNLRDKYRLNK